MNQIERDIKYDYLAYEKTIPVLSDLYSDLKDKYLKVKYGNRILHNDIRKVQIENLRLIAVNKDLKEELNKLVTQESNWIPGDERL